MARIHRMSKELAMLVAAGEVVERPGSVVKELVENAIDAGASRISAEIKNGGCSYIRVTDNGEGMEPEDVPTAFLRHATSKISAVNDLNAVKTLGFRGEALAAIAAVSRIDLFTKRKENPLGIHYVIEGGEEKENEETGCPNGTTIVVRDLFYNVPARMKFLKKDATEASVIESLVTNIAFSHPEIAFQLRKDGRDAFQTVGDGRADSVLYAICGSDTAKSLLPVNGDFGIIHVSGFVSPPTVFRSGRGYQNFYVNSRLARTASMLKTVDAVYKDKIPSGKYPICYLNIEINPMLVDVNVHPAKTEIKFSREKEVMTALYDAVSAALEGDRIPDTFIRDAFIPKAEPASFASAPETVVREKPTEAPYAPPQPKDFRPSGRFDTFVASPKADYTVKKPQIDPWKLRKAISDLDSGEQLSMGIKPQPEEEVHPIQGTPLHPATAPLPDPMEVRYVGEIFTTYILMADSHGFWMMDKHAAHERLLYQELLEGKRQKEGMDQLLLEPVTLYMDPVEKERLLENAEPLREIGFGIEDGGSAGLRVISAPAMIKPEDYAQTLSDIAEKLAFSGSPMTERMDAVLKSMACKAAIKAGKPSTEEEMKTFIKRVLSTPGAKTCPHGRPYLFHIGRDQFDRLFKRS